MLDELLATWREQRDTALADALDVVSEAERVEPLTGTVAQRIEA